MSETCYYKDCTNPPENDEHIPAQCFYPENKGVLHVCSCKLHNNDKDLDEYVKNIISLLPGNNSRGCEKANGKTFRSLDRNSRLQVETFGQELVLNDGNSAFMVDFEKVRSWLVHLTYGLFKHDFKKNHLGDWYIIDDTFVPIAEPGKMDCLEIEMRLFVRNLNMQFRDISEEQTFKYSYLIDVNGRIIYKFCFFENATFYAYSRMTDFG